MAEAKTPSASYLPGEDPDILEANRRYQEALSTLTDSLDARKNRYFEPTMLAMAQGFLAPTQTGSFGESLGNVAGKLGPAEAAAMKEQQDIAQQKLAAAGQGLELQRLKSRDAELGRYLSDEPGAGPRAAPVAGPKAGALSMAAAAPEAPPAAGALSTAVAPPAPVSGAPLPPKEAEGALPAPVKSIVPQAVAKGPLSAGDKPAGFEGVEGIQVAPANSSFMSARDYVRLNRFDKNKSPGDLIKEGQEIEQKRYRDKEGGVLDLATGKYYQFPTGKTEEIQLYGFPGTYKVDARTAALLSLYAANNDPRYHDLAGRVVKGPDKRKPEGEAPPAKAGEAAKEGVPAKAAEPTVVAEPAPRMKSKEEMELEQEKKKSMQAADVAQEIEGRKDFNQRRKDADETITTANIFRRFAADPKAKDMFGILSNDKISSGIATLIKDGFGAKDFRIGVPEIENVMRNANLNAESQAKYRTFLMYVAQMQLQQTKYMKGSVSNYEQQLMGSAGINAQDTPESIRMKADLLTRRAQFDRRASKAFKESKMTSEEFIDSDKYNEMRDKYNEDLAELATGSKILVAPPQSKCSGHNRAKPGLYS